MGVSPWRETHNFKLFGPHFRIRYIVSVEALWLLSFWSMAHITSNRIRRNVDTLVKFFHFPSLPPFILSEKN
jgi:hypothetical protein